MSRVVAVANIRKGWLSVRAGVWHKRVSLTGSYVAERGRDGRWSLSHEGAHSSHVGSFDTLTAVQEYVAVNR